MKSKTNKDKQLINYFNRLEAEISLIKVIIIIILFLSLIIFTMVVSLPKQDTLNISDTIIEEPNQASLNNDLLETNCIYLDNGLIVCASFNNEQIEGIVIPNITKR